MNNDQNAFAGRTMTADEAEASLRALHAQASPEEIAVMALSSIRTMAVQEDFLLKLMSSVNEFERLNNALRRGFTDTLASIRLAADLQKYGRKREARELIAKLAALEPPVNGEIPLTDYSGHVTLRDTFEAAREVA